MEQKLILLFGFILAVLLGWFFIPGILIIAHQKHLFDLPDERKIHAFPIPRLGGTTFFPIIIFVTSVLFLLLSLYGVSSIAFFNKKNISEFLGLIAGLILLYVVGVRDDLVGVRYSRKFLVQIIAALLILASGLYINNFYGLFGIGELPFYVGIPFTLLLTVFVTNAINLIDGIDGLASGLSIVAFTMFGFTFAIESLWMYSLLAFVCVGVLIPFFCYNVYGNVEKQHKIFMGDTGSLTLGFILSLMVIKYSMYNGEAAHSVDGAPLMTAFSMLLVSCFDVLRVVLGRLCRKAHPFKPDRTHLHHKFLDMGIKPRTSMMLIQLMAALFILATYVLINIGVSPTVVFFLILAIWILANIGFSVVIRRRNQ